MKAILETSSLILIGLLLGAAFLAPSCIYMDARNGCTDVRVDYAVTDSEGVSMAPSLDYHREGVGASNTNAARQDGRLSAVGIGDAALKAIGETIEACYTLGASKGLPILTEKLGRAPTEAEFGKLSEELAKLPKTDAKPISP